MRIGILGSGLMGSKLGIIFARAGHDVIFSYSRTRQKLETLAKGAGAQAHVGTPADATRDAVLLAVHWTRLDDVLGEAGTFHPRCGFNPVDIGPLSITRYVEPFSLRLRNSPMTVRN